MKRIGGILRGALLLLLVAVIGMNGVLLVKRLVYKEALPSLWGYSIVTVLSGSMEPEFSPGAMLLIQKRTEYQVGDVVTYEQQGSFVTHRIVEADETSYLTQGDANNAPDAHRIHDEDICGAVRLVIPGVGHAALFLKTPLGALVMILAFLALIEISFWRDRKRADA